MIVSALLVVVLLLTLNALYVAAEFAAVSVRRSQIQQLAEDGNPQASYLLDVVRDLRRLDTWIAACQVGITISSLVLGAYGEVAIAARLAPLVGELGGLGEAAAHSVASVVVLLALTALQLVLAELVPKSIALQYPSRTALLTVPPMRWSLRLLGGFIRLLNGSSNLVLKLAGSPPAEHRHIHSPDEIELLISESHEGGLLKPQEQARLHMALRLRTWAAHQLMVPRTHMDALDVAAPIEELLRRVADSPYTRLPVYRHDRDDIVGILHTGDLVSYYAEHGAPTSVEQVLRPALIVPETLSGDRLLALFRERHVHQGIVVDEFGGVEGLVTLEDVLARVMGEVGDELKGVERACERLADGRVRLPGRLLLDEAEPLIGVRWRGEADTVGGHVVEVLGHLPVAGEVAVVGGVEVEVEAVVGQAVDAIIVTPLGPAGEARPQ